MPVSRFSKLGVKTPRQLSLCWLDSRQGNCASKLGESQLADLYIWMSLAFPHALDPDHDGVHHMGSLEILSEARDSAARKHNTTKRREEHIFRHDLALASVQI